MKIFFILGPDLPESFGNIMQMVGSGNIQIGIMGDGYVSLLSEFTGLKRERENKRNYIKITVLQRY